MQQIEQSSSEELIKINLNLLVCLITDNLVDYIELNQLENFENSIEKIIKICVENNSIKIFTYILDSMQIDPIILKEVCKNIFEFDKMNFYQVVEEKCKSIITNNLKEYFLLSIHNVNNSSCIYKKLMELNEFDINQMNNLLYECVNYAQYQLFIKFISLGYNLSLEEAENIKSILEIHDECYVNLINSLIDAK